MDGLVVARVGYVCAGCLFMLSVGHWEVDGHFGMNGWQSLSVYYLCALSFCVCV